VFDHKALTQLQQTSYSCLLVNKLTHQYQANNHG